MLPNVKDSSASIIRLKDEHDYGLELTRIFDLIGQLSRIWVNDTTCISGRSLRRLIWAQLSEFS